MGNHTFCRQCGRCVLGCPNGAKWDSRRFLKDAVERGATLLTRHRVIAVDHRGGRIRGVRIQKGPFRRFLEADRVILAAGGLGTPAILNRSGLPVKPALFVDPVLTVAAVRPGIHMNREIPMPFIVRKEGYILSPYFDYLSYFFNRKWLHPEADLLGIMIKLADENAGSVSRRSIRKDLTRRDRERLREGVEDCLKWMAALGVRREETFLGTVNAGHPGGSVPMDPSWVSLLHPPGLPEGLFVADASLFPRSPGNPPSLTIMAMAWKLAASLIDSLQR